MGKANDGFQILTFQPKSKEPIDGFEWLASRPNPTEVEPDLPIGMRLHAVSGSEASGRALCRVRNAWGWRKDEFLKKKCAKCLRKLGIACKACGGVGFVRLHFEGRQGGAMTCEVCRGSGEA